MFSKIISTPGFWKSVFGLAIVFVIIYNIVDLGIGFSFDIGAYAADRFASSNLLRFFTANIGSGIVYGFVVTFFKFRSKIKQNQ